MMLYALFCLFVILSVFDGITTRNALKRAGTREANPVMAFLFNRFGIVQTLVVTKSLAIAAVWITLGPLSVWPLACVNALYAFVVWHNNYRVGR